MHRPLGRAALVVSAPFILAVARLHCPARLALAHLPAWVGGRAGRLGRLPFNAIPAGLPRFAGQLPKGLACSGFSPAGFRSLRRQSFWQLCPSASLKLACSGLIRLRRIRLPALANLASPSGRRQLISYATVVLPSHQKPARLVVVHRDLHSVVPFQQIIAS